MSKQTAVEWLVEQVKDYDFAPSSNDDEYVIVIPKWILSAKRDEAKAMFEEQLENSYFNGGADNMNDEGSFKEYYNQTYGGDK